MNEAVTRVSGSWQLDGHRHLMTFASMAMFVEAVCEGSQGLRGIWCQVFWWSV